MVVLGDEAMDGRFELVDGMKGCAFEPSLAELGEERLDGVEPRGRRGCEMESPARMLSEPRENGGMFVGGVIVDDRVDRLAAGDTRLKGVEEADEVLMPVVPHALADDLDLKHIERCEQRSGAMTPVIMRHGTGAPRFEGQAWLGAVECLDLAFFVDRQNHRMSGRIDVEPDDVAQLGSELGVLGTLEDPNLVRLAAVRLPCAAPNWR